MTASEAFGGKAVVITGGAGAIGQATAREFLVRGARVLLVDRDASSVEYARTVLAELGDVSTAVADVSSEDDVAGYVQTAVERFGTIDVFFNNAGIEGRMQPIVNTAAEDFDKVFAVNVRGVFLGLKHVLQVMLRQGHGSIINTSSEAGLNGATSLADYVASKHAVTGLTKAAALEVARDGIRVNSIHPSPVNTPMMRRLESTWNADSPETVKAEFEAKSPMGRYSDPSEIAKVVVFLASDDASFVNGAQIRIDGGNGAA
ncbi:SDR family NAD(P)-dependent oxidoreductase [Microbacterium keratanolyticum]